MKRGFTKKVIACVTALAMTLAVFPQSQLFLRGEKVEAAEGNILTDADIDKLYSKVSYNRQSVHDPSIIKNGSDYYVFGSHMGVAKTTDLMNWDRTPISDENAENAYYGIRNADGTITKVSFSEAFKSGGYTEVEVPFLASETLTGTKWWETNQKGKDYSIDNNSLILYVKADALIDNYGAFSVELQGGTWFFTTGSDKNAWFAEGATGNVEGVAEEKISTLTQDHTYKITITRTEQTVTVQYYDVDDNKEYCAFTGTSSNIPDALNVHIIAQVGTYTVTTEQPIEKKIIDFSSFPASDWNTAYNETVKGNMWAPDIIWNETMRKYCMYLSLNGSKFNSVVILLTSSNLEGPYVYEAPIIYSGFTNSGNTSYTKTDLSLVFNGTTDGVVDISKYLSGSAYNNTIWPHAIDPYVFYDDEGKLWMGYGSWSGGIYMIELDKTTGLRDYTVKYDYKENASDPYFGKKIAGGYYVSGEGPYIEKIGNYYFLFMSYGFYSPTGGYNMRIFRSQNPDGPYIDINGQNAIYTSAYPKGQNNHLVDSRGIQLMGNYQWDTMSVAEVAQGHNSAFVDDDGKAYVIYHTKFANDTADHQLRVHQLYLNEDGWIVAAPYEYAGEEVDSDIISKTPISQDKIIGDYNLIVHQYSNPKAVDEGTVANNIDIVKPVKVTLNSDGTISGAYTGTWSEKAGTAYATITIASKTYKGVFVEQTIDGTNIKTMCFTAVNTSEGTNHCIWGSKELSDSVIVAYNAKNPKLTIPSGTSSNLTLDTEGELGVKITWSSSDTSVLSNEGEVSQQTSDTKVTLTKTITKGEYYYQKDYSIIIYGTNGENANKFLMYNNAQAEDILMPVSAINEYTGVSLTFNIENLDSDQTLLFLTDAEEWIRLSILNYNRENIFPQFSATLSEEALNSGINAWELFLHQQCKATISYNVDGSISFYKDDVLMLKYGADVAIGSDKVSDLSKAIVNAVRNGGINVKYPVSNLSIEYALDYGKFDFANISVPDATGSDLVLPTSYLGYQVEYTSNNSSILSSAGVVTKPSKDTEVMLTITVKTLEGTIVGTKEHSILVYGTQGNNTKNLAAYNSVSNGMKLMGVNGLSNLKKTGVSLTFDIENLNSDQTLLILTDAEEWIRLPILNYDVANVFPSDAILSEKAKELGYTSVNAWEIFLNRKCTARISYNVDGSICFYRDGDLMLTYSADTVIGTKTVKDLTKAILQATKQGQLNIRYSMKNFTIGYADDYDPNYNPTAGYLYYEDYSEVTNNSIQKLWISPDAQSDIIVNSDDIHGNYFHFITGSDSGNREAYCNFFNSGEKIDGNYVLELDTQLRSGNIVQRSDSQFVITGNDSSWNTNSGINNKYILKLKTEEITSGTIEPGKPASDTQIWYINDTQEKVTIPYGSWVHIKAKVNTKNKTVDLTITNEDTIIYNKTVTMTSETGLKGLYVLRGRGNGFTKIDNIKVKEIRDFIAAYGIDNGNGTYTTGDWYNYTNYYPQILSENSEIKINFHNWSAGIKNHENYSIGIAPVGITDATNGTTNIGLWHLRADRYSNSTFDEPYNSNNVEYVSNWNWDDFLSMLQDAEINLTVKRKGSTITVHADIVGEDGHSAFYEAKTTKAPATGDLTLYLGGEACYLEIYDVHIFRNINSDNYEYGTVMTDDISALAGKTLTYQWYRSTAQITAENASSLIDGTLSEATAITGATDKEYEFQAEDIGKYIVAVVTITESNNKAIKTVAALPDKVQKKKLSISESVVENKIYDGTVDAKISSITFAGTVGEDTIAYDAVAEFADADAGTEKEVTGTVTLTEGSTDLYVLEDNIFTTKADIEKSTDTPNLPDALIKVSNSTQKVSEVELPTDWIWNTEDAEKEIPSGGEIKATAIYNGTDKGNYVTESIEITIQRTDCVHNYSTVTYANNAITISCSKCDSVRKVTLETGEGSIGSNYKPESTVENSILLPTGDTITKLGYTLKGWSDTASGDVKYQGETEYSKLFSTSDTITLYAIWETIEGPSGTITIANTKWDSFLTAITFGIYKSTQEEITIDAQAQNGIKAIHYIIAIDGMTYTEAQLAALPETDWIVYNSASKPKLQKNTKNVVYAKLEDNAGNISYISSNGIIEDEIVPNITEFDVITGELTDSSVSLSAKADKEGTYYFVLCKDSEDDLSDKSGSDLASAIIAKVTKSGAMTAEQMVIITEKGLEKATNYNAYIAIRDRAGNTSSRVCYFTTAQAMLELTNPTITGSVVYNSDLVADAKNKENLEDYSYQWYRSSSPITGDTNISSLELIGKAVRGQYTIQREDIGKYIAVTIALAHETYAGSCRAYTTEPVQPKTVTAVVSIKEKEYDGKTDAEISEIALDGIVAKDQDQVTAIAGTAIFADAEVGNDKEVIVSNIGLTGQYASCYQLEQSTIKTVGNIIKAKAAPNMPNAENVWNVSRDITKVSDITLPTDWVWLAEDAEKELPIETLVKVTAVYNGKDKGNYEIESVEISIQRSSCTHAETEIRNEKQATCTEAGYSGDTYCKTCEQLVSAGNTIAALGHSFTDYKENGDATCTEDGTKTAKCERCDETKTIISEGSKKGHTIVTDPAVEPSCTGIGKTEGKHCSACGEILEEQKGIAALGHDYTSEVTKKPTVTETGIRTYTCSRCDDSYTEEIPKLPEEEHEHQYTKSITKEPTCTVEGVTSYVCSCGDQYTEAIKALGHNYNIVITKPATTTETGIKTFTCSRCDDSYTEEIPKLSEEHEHKYTESITKEPTCTEAGVKTFVCDCGEKYTEEIEALGHDYEAVITKPATVTEAGIKTYTCSRCDDSYTEEIPKLSEEHEHKYTEKVTKEATCTEEGVKTFTCSCGEEYTEAIKALGHDYKSEITKPATVLETGIETFTCSRCKDSYTKEIPKLTQPLPPSGNTGSNSGSSGGTTGTTGNNNNSNNNTQTNDTNTGDTDNTGTTQKPEDTSNETPSQTITTETKPDGTIVETVKEEQPDGTKVETVTETKPNGTIVSTATETKTDGSVTSTKEIQLEDKSASLFTVVETTANGNVNVNSVIRTGLSDTSDTVNISEELLKDVAEDERLNSIIVEITDTTVNSATKENKKTIVNVNIPSVEGVSVEKVVLTKDSIEAAKNTGKGLVVNVINGCADKGTISNYKVTIPAKQLTKIDSNIQEINVEIIAEPVTNVSNASKKNAITKIVNKNKGKEKKTCVVSLAPNENVKAGMNVTIPVTDKTKITKGSKVYVYKYNAKTGKLIETANCQKTVSKDGTVTIAASSGKDYVISAKKLSGNKVQTIKDSISMSISKKTAKAGKTINVKISLPDTVSTKSKFGTEKATITYKSSDSKVASVSKSGVITTKKKGTAVVTATVKLASGQKVTKKQEITIK